MKIKQKNTMGIYQGEDKIYRIKKEKNGIKSNRKSTVDYKS